MARIGVCEDQPTIRRALQRALELDGHQVLTAFDGGEALRLFSDAALDAIIMDIGLPDADGRDVVQALQAAGQSAPVMFLTALDGMHDKLQGFAAGGDDYVVKPFEIKEILARVAVLVQRAAGKVESVRVPLRLDAVRHSVSTATGEALLTPTEFRMLAAVVARPGEVVRRRAVVAAGWPDGALVSENTIDSFMRRIRAKLAGIDSPVAITTIRGVGFRMVDA